MQGSSKAKLVTPETSMEESKSFMATARNAIAMRQMNKDAASPAIFNRLQEHLFLLKYLTKIKVEGYGEVEITVQNVIDIRTLREKPIVPTLMSAANI